MRRASRPEAAPRAADDGGRSSDHASERCIVDPRVAGSAAGAGISARRDTENGHSGAQRQRAPDQAPPDARARHRHSRRAPMSRLHSTFETVDSTLILSVARLAKLRAPPNPQSSRVIVREIPAACRSTEGTQRARIDSSISADAVARVLLTACDRAGAPRQKVRPPAPPPFSYFRGCGLGAAP